MFWRGRADVGGLVALVGRFLGPERAHALFLAQARRQGLQAVEQLEPDARLVHFAETQLAGAIGSASARVMIASVVEEEALGLEDVLRIVEEASELRHLNEQLRSLDRLKDDFVSSVTHELRTPLTSIRALAEMMADDPDMPPPQRAEFLRIVVAEAERLSRLVNQVLDMAKIESGHAEWHNADVDLPALLRQAAATLQELLRERGAQLVLELPDAATTPLPTLRADPDRLTQVVLNLLSNAVKFTPPGAGRIVLRLIPDKEVVTVLVHDNGPGVPAEQRGLIFERFRQGGDDGHRPQGTGLGLPISRRIVEHFGGRLELLDSPQGGACFAFTLPWRQAARPAAEPASAARDDKETTDGPQDPDRR